MSDERIIIVPLRKEFLKAPRYRRTKKAVNALREFIAKHTKTELSNVKLGKILNNKMWEHGIQNPPHKVKVVVIKNDKGIVMAELFGSKFEMPKDEDTKKSKVSDKKTEEAKVSSKKAEPKKAEVKTDVKETPEEESKTETEKKDEAKPEEKPQKKKRVTKKKAEKQ